jgi:hypothetical protein
MARPDFSDYVIHFTKGSTPWRARYAPQPSSLVEIAYLDAVGRLVRILEQRTIAATPMPWTDKEAVCFTESVWASLPYHAAAYSRCGIGFSKSFVFENDGGPAFYMRQDLYASQPRWPDAVWPFITPLVPEYASDAHVAAFWAGRATRTVDFTHEREWRVPHDLGFEMNDVAFVIVATGADEDRVVVATGGALQAPILLMDNYSRINELWPPP